MCILSISSFYSRFTREIPDIFMDSLPDLPLGIVIVVCLSVVALTACYIIVISKQQSPPETIQLEIVSPQPSRHRHRFDSVISMLESRVLHQEGVACGVCLEDLKKEELVIALPCDHYFHGSCIEQWITRNQDVVACPLCRKSIAVENDARIESEDQ